MDYRSLTAADQPILWEMLMYAAHESNLEQVQQLPALRHYAQDWGRPGDYGSGGWTQNRAVGAAWVRQFSTTDPGYGFVSDEIPELAIAVHPEYRGQGVGSQLLRLLMAQIKPKYPGISLSVRSDNPAIALYQRFKFHAVPSSEVLNRTGGSSFTMVHYF